MGAKSSIEWTDASWTPVRARVKPNAAEIAQAKGYTSLVQIAGKMAGHVGPHCEHASRGCDNCYSETNNGRCLPSNGTGLPFDRRSRDLVDIFLDEKILTQPLHWRAPRRVFVCSQTDLFGEFVSDEIIDRVFAVMALCPQHTFQVLTKRARRMREYMADGRGYRIESQGWYIERRNRPIELESWPLPNVWLGCSVEDQQRADERIPHLLNVPAAVRFLSVEPLLGPVDISRWLKSCCCCSRSPEDECGYRNHGDQVRVDWAIVGGESGPGARPMEEAWVRAIKDQCVAACVPFFYKQNVVNGYKVPLPELDGQKWAQMPAER